MQLVIGLSVGCCIGWLLKSAVTLPAKWELEQWRAWGRRAVHEASPLGRAAALAREQRCEIDLRELRERRLRERKTQNG